MKQCISNGSPRLPSSQNRRFQFAADNMAAECVTYQQVANLLLKKIQKNINIQEFVIDGVTIYNLKLDSPRIHNIVPTDNI